MKVKAPFMIFGGTVHELQVIKIHTFTPSGKKLTLGHLYCHLSRVHVRKATNGEPQATPAKE